MSNAIARTPVVGKRQSGLVLVLITTIIALSLGGTGLAQVIDFETVPGATPAVGLVITDQFEDTYGVRFSVSDSTPFVLGDYGGEFQGWVDDSLRNDMLAPGYDRGQFFAVYPNAQTPGRFLVIEYVAPTTAAAFDIIDIDDGPGTYPDKKEQWTIRVFDPSDSLVSVTVITAGDPGTGDGIPTRYSADFQGAHSIARIEVQYTGLSLTPGLAFDSFSPAASAGVPRYGTSWGRIKAIFGDDHTR